MDGAGWERLGHVLRSKGNHDVLAKFVAHSVALFVIPIAMFLCSYTWIFYWVLDRGWIPGAGRDGRAADEEEAMRVVFSVVAGVGALMSVLGSYVSVAFAEEAGAAQAGAPGGVGGGSAGAQARGKRMPRRGRASD